MPTGRNDQRFCTLCRGGSLGRPPQTIEPMPCRAGFSPPGRASRRRGKEMQAAATMKGGARGVAAAKGAGADRWGRYAFARPCRTGAALTALAIGAAASWNPAAHAQTREAARPAALALEEIVVTAQRREESVQNIPIAVSAFSTAELERRNITNTLDIVQYVPNLVGHNNTGLGTANTYYIRGSGNTESLASQDPPVGSYVDDIYISRQAANNFSLFDIERVEVLRGPQGTLFGRNTTGGAISMVMRKPAEEVGGFVEASYGRFNAYGARASIDAPLNAKFLTKISGYFNDADGYVRNTTTGEMLNGDRSWGVRAAARGLLSDVLTWDVSALHTDTKADNILNFDCDPANPADCDGRFATTGIRRNNGGQNQAAPLVIANGKGNLPAGSDTRFTLLASNLQAAFETITLNAITGWTKVNQDYYIDFFDGRSGPTFAYTTDPATGRPTLANLTGNINAAPAVRRVASGGFASANIAETKQFSQEFKANGTLFDERVKYVGGLYYIKEKNDTDFADIFNAAGAPLLLGDRRLKNTTEAWAAYAQADLRLLDTLSATAGLRYTDEKKEFNFSDNRAACQASPLPANCLADANFAAVDVDLNPATPPVFIPREQNAKIWTPRFALNFTPAEDVLLFASATRGFKSGAQSGRSTAVRLLLPTGPEKVWSYEAGAKTEWFDNRLRVNVTGFYQETTDLQVGSASVNALTGALSFTTRNFAGLEVKGLEIEAQAVPIDGLTLSLSAGLQDAKYTLDAAAPAVDPFNVLSVSVQQRECQAALAGQASPRGDTRAAAARATSFCGNGILRPDGQLAEPVRSPKLTLAFGASYEMPLPRWGVAIIPSLNVIYTSKQEVGTTNISFYRNAAGIVNVTGDGEFITGSFSKAHTLVNAGLAVQSLDDQYRLSLECDNCFGVTYVQATLSNYSYLNPPSSWTVRLRAKF
jgi:iron complex outermembrane receptor protein